MNLGNKIFFIIIFFLTFKVSLLAEDKIISSPLINIDKIKPSFEEFVEENENISSNQNLKDKKIKTNLKSSQAIIIGLVKSLTCI